MSTGSVGVVIPGFMPGIQGAAGALWARFEHSGTNGACASLDPEDKPRDDMRGLSGATAAGAT
jgi:hypothetical protein